MLSIVYKKNRKKSIPIKIGLTKKWENGSTAKMNLFWYLFWYRVLLKQTK